jgi:thiamine monophosphate synthase
MMGGNGFLLAVITSPGEIPREAEYMEGLLEAGLERLHLRKPGWAVEELLERLAPRWKSRLVVHGSAELAARHGVEKVHRVNSTSVHSWEELRALPPGLDYAFISPVFDSISKPGYQAAADLLEIPPGPLPCRPVGLGGVSADTIGLMLTRGWTGAAVLGWIWEKPREAVSRFEQLKKIVHGQANGSNGSGV